jgi:RNA polymerase sigma factor (sigma-70 family)
LRRRTAKNTEGQRVWQTSQDYPDKAEVSLDEWQGWEDLRATLPKHEFEVLELTHQGRSQEEIAQELGIAVDTVKKRKARAKKRLEPKRNAG